MGHRGTALDVIGLDGVGLCRKCVHVRVVHSDKGSTFFRCGEAERNPQLPKYPRLPVLICPHFREGDGWS